MNMTFGKKCPRCGDGGLEHRTPASGNASPVPSAGLFCPRCRQPVRYRFPCSYLQEDRAHPRKQLPVNFLARIRGMRDQYAQIKDISPGGLCFQYPYSSGQTDDRLLTVDLFNCNDGSSLEQLQVEIIASAERLTESAGGKRTVLEHRARFLNLNQAQVKILTACIARYGHEGPQPDA